MAFAKFLAISVSARWQCFFVFERPAFRNSVGFQPLQIIWFDQFNLRLDHVRFGLSIYRGDTASASLTNQTINNVQKIENSLP